MQSLCFLDFLKRSKPSISPDTSPLGYSEKSKIETTKPIIASKFNRGGFFGSNAKNTRVTEATSSSFRPISVPTDTAKNFDNSKLSSRLSTRKSFGDIFGSSKKSVPTIAIPIRSSELRKPIKMSSSVPILTTGIGAMTIGGSSLGSEKIKKKTFEP